MYSISDLPSLTSSVGLNKSHAKLHPFFPAYVDKQVIDTYNWYELVFGVPEFVNGQLDFQQKALQYSKSTGVLKLGNDKELYAGFMIGVNLPEARSMLNSIKTLPRSRDIPTRIQMLRAQEIIDVSVYIFEKLEPCGMVQAASQFNGLEMVSPSVTPQDGIGVYTKDRTQGPAVALTAAGALHMRNYWVTNTLGRQFNGLEECGFPIKNGYLIWGNNPGQYLEKIDENKIRVPFSLYAQVAGLHSKRYEGEFYYHHTDKLVHQAYTSSAPIRTYGNGGDYQTQLQLVYKILRTEYRVLIAMTLIMWHFDRQHGRVTTAVPTVDLGFIGAGVFNNPPDLVMAAMAEAMYEFQEYSISYRIHAFTPTIQQTVQKYLDQFGGFNRDRFAYNINEQVMKVYGKLHQLYINIPEIPPLPSFNPPPPQFVAPPPPSAPPSSYVQQQQYIQQQYPPPAAPYSYGQQPQYLTAPQQYPQPSPQPYVPPQQYPQQYTPQPYVPPQKYPQQYPALQQYAPQPYVPPQQYPQPSIQPYGPQQYPSQQYPQPSPQSYVPQQRQQITKLHGRPPLPQNIILTPNAESKYVKVDYTLNTNPLRPQENIFPDPEAIIVAVADDRYGTEYEFYRPMKYQKLLAQAAWELDLENKSRVTSRYQGLDDAGRNVDTIVFKEITPLGIFVGYEAPATMNFTPRINYFLDSNLLKSYGYNIFEKQKQGPYGPITYYDLYPQNSRTKLNVWPPKQVPMLWPKY